jgi:hypothetical protein
MLINPKTRKKVLLSLYYAQDSIIQIDINNTIKHMNMLIKHIHMKHLIKQELTNLNT